MARRLSWFDVRGGLIAAIAIVLVAAATLKYSRLGTLHGDTMELVAHFGEARGLLVGSEVWLSGQKIGKVLSIDFRSPQAADTSARIEVRMAILSRHRAAIHRDAVATIQAGGSVIGSPVVYFTPGSTRTGMIQPGDTITTHPAVDAEGAAAQFSVASRQFPVIINNIKLLAGELSSTKGTAGAFMNAPGGTGLPPLPRTKVLGGRLYASLNGGGSVGRIMSDGLTARINTSLSRVDSIRTLLASPNTSFGRFRKDSTLITEVGYVRDDLSMLRAQLDDSRGTAGRMLHDSAIGNGVIEAERQMSLLFADIKKHPFRYIVF
jgi:ABC-type transport system involved in resistance to organic solvents, periplasmic component